VPLPGARDLPVLTGLSAEGGLIQPQENVLVQFGDLLEASARVIRYESNVCFESRLAGSERTLIPLSVGPDVLKGAAAQLANLMVCRHGDREFPLSQWFTQLALRAEPVLAKLPQVQVYATRPVFDDDFVFRGPGWHPGPGILVHGPAVVPLPWPSTPVGGTVLFRLPPHLRALLGGFCFRDEVDLVNALALLLTGLVVPRYVRAGKPIGLVDGNQPGVGKTLLVRAIGVVLDGVEPGLTPYTPDDDEMQKRIGARLRTGSGSLVVLDNAKSMGGAELNSMTVEMLTTAPVLELRVLGTSTLHRRPNDVLWVFTMNGTQASADLVTRGLPVRLAHEGDPGQRQFFGLDPVEYAFRHRVELLGELAGMVDRWTAGGRPRGTQRHRFSKWAEEIGGILAACGLPELLSNMSEATSEFSTVADEIAALAEHVVKNKGPTAATGGKPAADWVRLFEAAGVRQEELRTATTPKAKTIRVGKTLGPYVGRRIEISVDGKTGKAVLRSTSGRSRQKDYHFEYTWDADGEVTGQPAAPIAPEQPAATLPDRPQVVTAQAHGGNNEAW
jgi:hypothetical protein